MKVKVTEQVFREAIARLSQSDDGRVVLAWLANYCFHTGPALDKSSLENTYANAAVQSVYRTLRTFIKPKDLREIEFFYDIVKEEENNE